MSRIPIVFVVIESLDRSLSLGVGVHLDEAEPLAAARVTVLDDLGALHGAERVRTTLADPMRIPNRSRFPTYNFFPTGFSLWQRLSTR